MKWSNDYYKRKFGENIIGTKCYKYIKNFEEPCSWCPHTKVFKNKSIYTTISPSSDIKDSSKLKYFQLVSLPYKYDELGNVELIVEFLVDFSDIRSDIRSSRKYLFENSQTILNRLREIPDSYIPFFLLVSVIWNKFLNFSNATIYYYQENENNDHSSVKVFTLSQESAGIELISKFEKILYLKDESTKNKISSFTGYVTMKCKQNTVSGLILDNFPELKELMIGTEKPMRIDKNKIGVRLPFPSNGDKILLVAENTKKNSFLTDKVCFDFTLFVASIIDLLNTKVVVSNMNHAIENITDMFSDNFDDNYTLIHAIPFAVGKAHDLSKVYDHLRKHTDVLSNIKFANSSGNQHEISKSIEASISCILDEAKELKRILDSMKSINDMRTPHIKEFFLSELLKEVKSIYLKRFEIESNNIILKIDVHEDILVYGDRNLLFQVFQNLIENSIFAFLNVSRKHKIIDIKVTKSSGGVIITIEDNATGIPPELLYKVWEMYVSYKPKGAGTGLGLYFVKFIIEEVHKGEIALSSVWGKKTFFTISLPNKNI